MITKFTQLLTHTAMIDPLFTVFLSKIGDSSLSWGVGKVLDVVANCFKCSEPNPNKIANQQLNIIECKNCSVASNQFTHACEQTIRTENLQIVHAAVGFKSVPSTLLYSERSKGWFSSERYVSGIDIPFHIQCHALHHRTARVDCTLQGAIVGEQSRVISTIKPADAFDLNWKLDQFAVSDESGAQHGCNCSSCQRKRAQFRGSAGALRANGSIATLTIRVTTDSGQLLSTHNRYIQCTET